MVTFIVLLALRFKGNFLCSHFIYYISCALIARIGLPRSRSKSFRGDPGPSDNRAQKIAANTLMATSQRVEPRVAVVLLMLLCCVNACTVATASTKQEFKIGGAAGKYNANHTPVISRQDQSQLHHDVVRALRTAAEYSAFAAVLDNMNESVIRQGITVFAPNNKALSVFQKTRTEENVQDVMRFHIIKVFMPFSNLLRLEVGSRLTTDVSNFTVQVTNSSESAYKVEDAWVVDPDLYTDATIAVHGINAVFNTSKIIEEEEHGESTEEEPRPTPFIPISRSHAFKFSIQLKNVSVHQILMTITVLYFLKLTVSGI